jgi:DNA repair protein RecO (recombination protein O)
MTVRYKTRAFVFQKNDINESDRIFSVFSASYGRLDLFAKSVRKSASKLRCGIDIFSFSDIEFIQGKNRKTLTDSVIKEKFGNIPQNPQRFEVANKIGKVLQNFVRGEERDDNAFTLLNEVFGELNNGQTKKDKADFLYYYFIWNFLALQGYGPEVSSCAGCKGKLLPYGIFFSFKEGGVICKNCFNPDKSAQKINSDIVKILRIILRRDWQTISKIKIGPDSIRLLEELSQKYCSYLMPG